MADIEYTYRGSDGDIDPFRAMLTSRDGDGGGDFEEAYRSALTLAAAGKAGGAFLDVGSGLGRIIEIVRPFAKTVVGLEPDRERYLSCNDRFRRDSSVEVFNTYSSEFRGRNPSVQFDFIALSMVLQHVSTATCQAILGDVREMLAPDGLAVVSTTHVFEERFTCERDPSPKDVRDYDRYAEDTSRQDKGIPVRMFSRESLRRTLERAGLEIVVWQQFSYARPESLESLARLYAVSPDDLRDVGISQFCAVRRADRPAGVGGARPQRLRRRSWLRRFVS